MSTEVILYVLTGLGALVVLLTRVRLGSGEGAGRHVIGRGLLGLHTVAGVLAVVTWLAFLLGPEESLLADSLTGIVALGLWWQSARAPIAPVHHRAAAAAATTTEFRHREYARSSRCFGSAVP